MLALTFDLDNEKNEPWFVNVNKRQCNYSLITVHKIYTLFPIQTLCLHTVADGLYLKA